MNTLKELAAVSTIGFGYAFFAGWVYLTTYFGSFDVDLWVLDVPAYNFAPLVGVELRGALIIIAITVSAYLYLHFHIKLKKALTLAGKKSTWLPKLWIGLALFVWFLLTIAVAYSEGVRNARSTVKQATPVHLVLKGQKGDAFDPGMLQANKDGRPFLAFRKQRSSYGF